jgi:hypothetical protein
VKTVCDPIAASILCLFSVQALAQGQGPPTANPSLPKPVRVLEAATPLRTGPGVTYPIVITEAAGTVLELTGRDGDWYRITLSPDMVADPNAPRTVYVLARLVSPAMGSITTPQGIPPWQPPPPAIAQGLRTQAANETLPKSVRVVDASTPLRTGPGVTYPIVLTEAAGAVLEVTGRNGDWYRIALSPDMVADPDAPRTVYVLARLVETVQTNSGMQGAVSLRQIPNSPQQPPVGGSMPTPTTGHEVLLGGHVVLDYDAGVWTRTTPEQPGSFQLTYLAGDISARVITEGRQIQLDKIADIELASIKQTDPKAHLIDRGFETVNGRKMATFQILASAGGIESWYYERCYSDSAGTIEIVAVTASDLAQQAGPIIDKLVDGLRIVRK